MQTAMKPLNLNDEWEEIINANRDTRQKQTAAKHRRHVLSRAKKLAISALVLAAISLLLFLVLPDFFPLSAAFACCATLQIGRFLEAFGK